MVRTYLTDPMAISPILYRRPIAPLPSVLLFAWPLAGLLLLSTAASAQTRQARFSILKGGEEVGSIHVLCATTGPRTLYAATSYSELDVVWKQVVRTSMGAEYLDGSLTACHSALRVNDALRDSSNMVTREGRSTCYVHPRPPFTYAGGSQWTTARMYFEEPVGQPTIFVESVMQDCPLRRTGAGTYTLTFPNKCENHYVYMNGVLQEVRVDRTLIDLVFRRT